MNSSIFTSWFAAMLWLALLTPSLQAQSIDIETDRPDLQSVLESIEAQSSYSPVYSEDDIDLDQTLELPSGTYQLDELLEQLEREHALEIEKMENQLVLKPLRTTGNIDNGEKRKVTGRVYDQRSGQPLPGAAIVHQGKRKIGTVTDSGGYFALQLPLGRHSLVISYMGFSSRKMPLHLTAGHQPYLEIGLEPSVDELQEVEVTDSFEKDRPVNAAIYNSGRSFSLEEAYRYAGSLGDPARMVRNFAGIVPERDDRNDIVIRGNSPTGLLWRLDGIEIPNPNHFGGIGLTGNTVTLLNMNLLDNSDFLTGAFPSSYGNATAGVFDLHLRRPNPEEHQFWFQSGWNGLEAGTEGPLSDKDNPASYMAVYRYSFLDAMNQLGMDIGGVNPQYQDFTTKVDMPVSEQLDLSLIGMATTSHIDLNDQEQEEDYTPVSPYGTRTRTGSDLYLMGLNADYRPDERSELKAGISVIDNDVSTRIDTFSLDQNDRSRQIYREASGETKYSLFADYNRRTSAQNNLRLGMRWDSYDVSYHEEGFRQDSTYGTFVNSNSDLHLLRLYAEDEYFFNDQWRARLGLHGQYLFYNDSRALEPRAGIEYQFKPDQRLSLSYGLHHQMQPRTLYFVETHSPNGVQLTNKNLDFTRSHHLVLGYHYSFAENWRLKAESYYQALSQIPVKRDAQSSFSLANVGTDFFIPTEDSLVNEGLGRNYGLELTLEKFLSNGYYFMLNGSIYESEYRSYAGDWHHTAFNLGYMWNALAGYEYWFNNKFALGADLRATQAGGKPYTPVNEPASRARQEEVLRHDRAFSQRFDDYFRLDIRFYYRINFSNAYMEFAIDIQNLTDRENTYLREFVPETGEYNTYRHTGFFLMPTFKLQF